MRLRWPGTHSAAAWTLVLALQPGPASAAGPPASGASGVVVAADLEAANSGARMLARGGNAVDAAVATAFALAVTHPQAGNLGGGGFLLYRGPRADGWVVDFRERAPAAAGPRVFLGADGRYDPNRSRRGPTSVGVPGTVAGLLLAHRRFGTRPRPEVLADAVDLAREGFVVSPTLARDLEAHRSDLGQDPYTAAIFLRGDRAPRAGELLVQADLAALLQEIARHGEEAFYRGEAALALERSMHRWGGGPMRAADLDAYRAEERAPLVGTYRDIQVWTTPPPSGGGVALLQMLQILQGAVPHDAAGGAADRIHRLAAAMHLAFADRARYLGDPSYVEVPLARLLSPEHTRRLREAVPAARALVPDELPEPAAGGMETTHISVVDAAGGAVALTLTLNSSFGSGRAVEDLGYLLNNEMDDFSAPPGSANLYGLVEGGANVVAPGKRMVSSMAPTIAVRGGQPLLVVGAAGGPRIPTAILQVLLNLTDRGMVPEAALAAPRVHHQWRPDVLRLEPGAASGETLQTLAAMGYRTEPAGYLGVVNAAGVDPTTGLRWAAPDPRRDGYAVAAAGIRR